MGNTTPRGIRNNNPLNIERVAKNKWQGKVASLPNVPKERRFEQFSTPIYGIRAGAALVVRHFDRRNANTIGKMIAIWAPATENNTGRYAEVVARAAQVGVNEVVDFHDYDIMRPVIEAMIRHENGEQPYTPAQIDKGLALAGILPPAKPAASTGTVKGAAGAGGSFAGAEGVDQVQDAIATASGPLYELAPYLTFAKWGLVILGFISLGYVIYRRWDDLRRFVR